MTLETGLKTSLVQRAVTSHTNSIWRPVTSDLLCALILSEILFNILLNDLEVWTKCTLSRFADDTKLGNTIVVPDRSAWTVWTIGLPAISQNSAQENAKF